MIYGKMSKKLRKTLKWCYDKESKLVSSDMVEAVLYLETLPDDDYDDVIFLG